VQDSWTRARDILEAGGIVSGTAHAIIPIVMGESLGGLLFLDAPQAFDARATLPFIDAIGRAMADPIPGEERDAAPVSLEPGGKDELLTALHRSEWNLARAARMCGCSRRTIYLRMERYGIERRKVPKSVRRPVR
jgi:DNA-binding NtrC family response regulator